jgi:hypothetical protein
LKPDAQPTPESASAPGPELPAHFAPDGFGPSDSSNTSETSAEQLMANADEAVFVNPPQEEEGVRENVGPDEPNISGIAEAIIDLMCPPTVIDAFPENERPLVDSIAQTLYPQIRRHMPELADEIRANSDDDIVRILADQQRGEARREHFKRAQEANMRELREHAARNGRAAAHLNPCCAQAQAAVKAAYRTVDDSVPIFATSLSGDGEDVIPDFEFAGHPDLPGISGVQKVLTPLLAPLVTAISNIFSY